MNDGTTPLILAARLAVEGMVPDLINADAEINGQVGQGGQGDGIEVKVKR